MKKNPPLSQCFRASRACARSSLQARREFVMSRCHTRIVLTILLVSVVSLLLVVSFQPFRFGRFGGFVSLVSVVCFGRFVSLFRVLVRAKCD